MIAIVDGGSTKCDWVILEADGTEVMQTETVGFNPNIIEPGLISVEIHNNKALELIKSAITHIYFYGSGCGTKENCETVERELRIVFPSAKILVKEDLTAAAYSAYRGTPAIVCILGTGSNSCYFDGENLRRELPSLGFLIGDEGSGSAIGKQLIRRYFMEKLPFDLHEQFTELYRLEIDELLQNMFHNPRVNAYFAEFTRFVVDRKTHPYFQQMLIEEFQNFFEYQVLPYRENRSAEINFIGSIAYFFEDSLRAAAAAFHLNVGMVVQRPIENLVNYHREYILPSVV
ncbi:MAG: ATPase [Chryseobacterium sp.]|nr:MAG: ATPase [Chryseobacterium sp.]